MVVKFYFFHTTLQSSNKEKYFKIISICSALLLAVAYVHIIIMCEYYNMTCKHNILYVMHSCVQLPYTRSKVHQLKNLFVLKFE